MKSLFLYSFLMFGLLTNAQIPQKANMIIITGNESQQSCFKQVNEVLFENGYGILTSDSGTGTITTTDKSYKRGNIKFTFLIKDNEVIVRGQYSTSFDSYAQWSDVIYKGMKGSPMLLAWEEMTKIADEIPGQKEYLIK